MKHLLPIILSILLLSACGESGRMQFEQLQQIDSIAEVNADSAVAMIKTINRDTLSSNDNKYYYDLLKIRTNDKAYIAHTSDSAMLSVINYFENHDFNNLLPVAYYYGGRVYSDLGDAPQALEYFHKAIDCPNITSNTMAVAYAQIAGIYHSQKVYDLAIPAYKKAIELNNNNNNITNSLYNTLNLANIYILQNRTDSAFILHNFVLNNAKELTNSSLILSSNIQLANIHLLNNNTSAHKILKSIKTSSFKEDSTAISNSFAQLYYKLNNIDSTLFYCNKLIKSKNLNIQLEGYNILANLHIKNKNIDDAYNAMIMSTKLSDTIRKLQTPQEIRQLSSLYNYQIRERENNNLKKDAHENEIKIFFLICLIVIIIVIALSTIYIARKRKRIINLKLQNVELLLKQSNNLSETTIAQNKEKISLLESQINSINNENQSLIQELKIQKKLLELNNEKAIIYKSQKDNAILIFNNDTFVKEIHSRLKNTPKGKNILSEKEWNTLIDKIIFLFPAFMPRSSTTLSRRVLPSL